MINNLTTVLTMYHCWKILLIKHYIACGDQFHGSMLGKL